MSAYDTQSGGSHYRDMAIQPSKFIKANDIPWFEANVIKYICRWRAKNGMEDLRKARHYLDLLIEEELGIEEMEDIEDSLPEKKKLDPVDIIGEENNINISPTAAALIERQCEDCG